MEAQTDLLLASTNGHSDVVTLPSHDGRELLDKKLETPEFDVPDVIAPGVITADAGFTGAGKTPKAGDLIKSMLEGREFCGIEIHQALPAHYKFVYYTQESEYTFKPMLEKAGLGSVLKSGQLEIMYLYEVLATGASWEEIIEGAYDKFESPRGLLIVDPISDLSMVKNEDDNSQMAEVYRPLVAVVGTGLSIYTIVHAWKSFDTIPDDDAGIHHIRGAGAIVSNCSLIWTYKHPFPKVENPNVRFMRQVRNRFRTVAEDRYVELGANGLEVVENPHGIVSDYFRERGKVLTAIEGSGKTGILNSKLAEISGVERHKLSQYTQTLENEESIYSTGKKQSPKDPLTWRSTVRG